MCIAHIGFCIVCLLDDGEKAYGSQEKHSYRMGLAPDTQWPSGRDEVIAAAQGLTDRVDSQSVTQHN